CVHVERNADAAARQPAVEPAGWPHCRACHGGEVDAARPRASITLTGVQGHLVEVEADITSGPSGLLLAGLPDTVVRQTKDRVRAAILNSGEPWPQRKITVTLSPVSLPKCGTGSDLAIAAAIL